MKRRQAWILGSLVVVSSLALPMTGRAADSQRDLRRDVARDLIATMKLDEQAAQKAEAAVLAWCRAKECDADMRRCVLKFDREEITRNLVVDAENALTVDEMREAIAYFRTETGLKHLDVLRAEQGLGGDATFSNQAPGDRARMLAFLDTRAGYLIITRSVLTSGSYRWAAMRAELAGMRCIPRG